MFQDFWEITRTKVIIVVEECVIVISDWGLTLTNDPFLEFFGYLSMTLKAKASKAIYPTKHM